MQRFNIFWVVRIPGYIGKYSILTLLNPWRFGLGVTTAPICCEIMQLLYAPHTHWVKGCRCPMEACRGILQNNARPFSRDPRWGSPHWFRTPGQYAGKTGSGHPTRGEAAMVSAPERQNVAAGHIRTRFDRSGFNHSESGIACHCAGCRFIINDTIRTLTP